MTTILCVLLSALGFYFSLGLGEQWWLAWLAPIPILWLAFGDSRAVTVFIASWAAMALGGTSLLRAYGGSLPPPVLALAIGGPALLFAVAVMGARRVLRKRGALAATVAFAALWTALDFASSFNSAGGAASSPANAEVGMPVLIQIAALVGFLGITFLLGFVAAGIAASLRLRDPRPAGIAIGAFVASALFGIWRVTTPPSDHLRVALIESDHTVGMIRADDQAATQHAIDAYVGVVDSLRDQHVQLIVLPENIARVAPEWRAQAQSNLESAATRVGVTLVAGFNTLLDGAQRNISWAFSPGATQPVTYEKRRLVPVLESTVYAPGPGPVVLPNGIGLEICKDMDFHAMVRRDAVATRPRLLAVPAWDFDRDDWSHARVAVLRSVENGVPMARTARDGLLILSDRYGRLIARARTVGGFTVLVGELPLDGRGGDTVYDRIGDLLGWCSALVALGLLAWSL